MITGQVQIPLPASDQHPIDWRRGLPVLQAPNVTLRGLEVSDAVSLLTHLAAEDVQRYIEPGPASVAAFEHFIDWTHRAREAGRHLSYGIVPRGYRRPVGLLQIWRVEPTFRIAEAGIGIGSAFWGSGLFLESARLFLDFVFDRMGVHRVEGRSACKNGRGNAALMKLGAVQEGVLRQCLPLNDMYEDHIMWSMLAEDWRRCRRGAASDHQRPRPQATPDSYFFDSSYMPVRGATRSDISLTLDRRNP